MIAKIIVCFTTALVLVVPAEAYLPCDGEGKVEGEEYTHYMSSHPTQPLADCSGIVHNATGGWIEHRAIDVGTDHVQVLQNSKDWDQDAFLKYLEERRELREGTEDLEGECDQESEDQNRCLAGNVGIRLEYPRRV